MVEEVSGGKALPVEVVQQIVRKTDGVPLFVEELTKMVLESGLVREEEGRYVGAQGGTPIPPLAIPSTLHDSLMARLDRLAPVREIAQVGAVLGREFSYDLLHAVSRIEDSTLQQGLRRLVDAELLYQRGSPPQATYLFKHALIQDTAYHSLLKSKRQQLHQQIAQVLAAQFPETLETQAELLAHHYTEANLLAQAIPYWQRAGQRATQRSANVEAIAHLSKGLELLKTLPDTPERTQQELTLQIALGDPLMAIKGYAAPEVEQICTRTLELCRQVGETPQIFPVLFRLRAFYLARGELQTARELAEQCLILAQRAQDPALLLLAHMGLGTVLYLLGEFAPTRKHLEQGIALYNSRQRKAHTPLYGTDPGVVCLSVVALTLWFLGYPNQALKRINEALTLAQKLSHSFSLAYAEHFVTLLHQFRCEEQAIQEWIKIEIALSSEQGFPYMLAWGTILRGWLLAEQRQEEEGIVQIQQSLAAFRATGVELWRLYHLALLAQAYGKVGRVEEGLAVLAEALAAVDKAGERMWEAELYRLRGELTLQSKVQGLRFKVEEAEEYFLKAIETARKQQAKSLELRAVMSLSRLWQSQSKTKEAHGILVEIYNWFTEGFDTKDLQEAKRLIEELS
jgi:predicted ATPase